MHPLVDRAVAQYLSAIDAEAPNLVEGLYLTGSAALGDFRPRSSDIDFVAVTATRPDSAGLAALARAHRRLRTRCRRPCFDGLYVTWDDLANDPVLTNRAPHSCEGRFRRRSTRAGDPVIWHTLAQSGIPCRGPKPADLDVWLDGSGLARWTLDNLKSYWRPLVSRSSGLFHRRSLIALTSYGTVWIVLGVSRLHYTLATGRICSKEDAGTYALRTFPAEWHRVVEESLRLRRADLARPDWGSALDDVKDSLRTRRRADSKSSYATLHARRRDVLSFCEMVIADAFLRYG